MDRHLLQTIVMAMSPFVIPLLFRAGRELYMRIWKWIRSRHKTTGDLWRFMEQIALKVDRIHHEVLPNNTGSLRDAVTRIEIGGRRREAMARASFANNAEGQFETDADGNLTWANETFLRWTGCNLRSLSGRGWISCIAEQDQERFVRAFDLAVREKREFRGQCLMRAVLPPTDTGPGGIKHFPADWRATLVPDPIDHTHVGFSGNVRRRMQTGEQPAIRPMRAVPLFMREDNGN